MISLHLIGDSRRRKSPIEQFQRLTLALFVFWVDANYPHDALAVDNLALVTHLFNRRTDLHFDNPQIFSARNRMAVIYSGKYSRET
jgi:hypothetical protein